MEKGSRRLASLLTWTLVAGFLSQNLVLPVMSTSFGDQKNFFLPVPSVGAPPTTGTPTYTSPPPHGSGGTPPSRTPTYASPPPHGSGGTPPSRTPTYTSPPPHGTGGTPPSRTPTYTSPPPHGSGGTPPSRTPTYTSPPPYGSGGTPPSPPTPPTPSGRNYGSPPYAGRTPPRSPSHNPTPPTPAAIIPGTPTVPTPPSLPDPNSNPFTGTCDFWKTHPELIMGLFGWWTNIGSAFGAPSLPGSGAHLSLQQALSNTHSDGYGALYREGTASLLNSMVNKKFPFSTKQVRERFSSALVSDKAAASQARLFKLANEGRLQPRT